MFELEKVGVKDIEKLIRLADDVVRQMEVNAYLYDDEGVAFYETITYLKKQMEPYRTRIIGLFRNGTLQDTVTNETSFVADDTVTDDYLMELFVMRIRDRRIIMAVQNFPKTYYLLLRDYPCIEEVDKYVGIYDDIRKLRQAYETEREKLVSEKDKYPFVLSLQIYEFEDEADGKQVSHGRLIKPEELWGVKCE